MIFGWCGGFFGCAGDFFSEKIPHTAKNYLLSEKIKISFVRITDLQIWRLVVTPTIKFFSRKISLFSIFIVMLSI